MRYKKETDDQFNTLNVTPEFQNFVAKRLSDFLEQQLKSRLEVKKNVTETKCRKLKTGVKLFHDSNCYLEVTESENVNNGLTTKIKRPKITKRSCDTDNQNESAKVNEVAVSPEYILNKTETKHWSNRSKAPVFNYRKISSGELIYIAPKFT